MSSFGEEGLSLLAGGFLDKGKERPVKVEVTVGFGIHPLELLSFVVAGCWWVTDDDMVLHMWCWGRVSEWLNGSRYLDLRAHPGGTRSIDSMAMVMIIITPLTNP
ncbi:hypothetical protein N7493_004044 [Penicillium malachiteum]|uniref:Uncharacterized protein n=1 Tax=Penicillium malachiteum TaxID=1324776 RepID=A0AAD6HRT8_9EURO|nr:hypothetical protein N7493_004044 [Penicillium malachiteum]